MDNQKNEDGPDLPESGAAGAPTVAFMPAAAPLAPHVTVAFDAFGHPRPDAPAAGTAEAPILAAPAPTDPHASNVADGGVAKSPSTAAPVISIAGLHAAGQNAQSTLWRKIRGNGPEIRPADVQRQKAPIIPPPQQRAGTASAAGSAARNGRFALLAASIALAAGVGAAAGGAGIAGLAWAVTPTPKPVRAFASGPAPLHRTDLADETRILKDGLAQVRGSIRTLSENVGGVRATIDNSGKGASAQIAKLNDQVAKLNDAVARLEHAQSEPAARLAKAIDTLEKLERRGGTLASTETADRKVAAVAPAPAPDTTGSVPAPAATPVVRGAPPQPLRPPAIDGWVVRRVFDGVALLDGPDRSIEVELGDNIRGVGRVEDIQRQGNRWVVVTSRGLIVSR